MALTKKQQVDALLQAAIDSYHAGKIAEAIDHLVRGSGTFPKVARLWGYLGFLHSQTGEYAKAVQAFRKTIALSPHSEKASLGLFHSLWHLNKTDAAFDEMRRFVQSNDSPHYRQLLRGMLADGPETTDVAREPLVVA